MTKFVVVFFEKLKVFFFFELKFKLSLVYYVFITYVAMDFGIKKRK